MTTFTSLMRQYRKQAGLTLTELSSRVGITKSYLSRIERLERFPPAAIMKKIIEEFMKCEVDASSLRSQLLREGCLDISDLEDEATIGGLAIVMKAFYRSQYHEYMRKLATRR